MRSAGKPPAINFPRANSVNAIKRLTLDFQVPRRRWSAIIVAGAQLIRREFW